MSTPKVEPVSAGEPLWRQEFPIRAGDERLVTRRQLAKFLTLTSLGMLAGNLWILARSLFKGPAAAFVGQRIAAVGEIPIGSVRLFSYPGPHDPCILVRVAEDRFEAYSQKCTHLSCAVYFEAARGTLECPCHNGRFAVADGRVLAGPPPRPLPRILLERRGDDIVAVGVDMQVPV
jgi:nitrite reductase/ring-hydroxylating ferredoxin subunit